MPLAPTEAFGALACRNARPLSLPQRLELLPEQGVDVVGALVGGSRRIDGRLARCCVGCLRQGLP